jgi:RNA polymerase sigma-70 factor, ECF subfamily
VRALSGWRGRRCNGNLRAWLYKIVYNGFVTDQRRRRLRQICYPSLTEVVENDLLGVDGGQETLLAYRDLRRGLANLPDDQRAVLLLISVEDFSYEEAARILRVPIGTVMSRLSRGRERLRQHMNGGQSRPGRQIRGLILLPRARNRLRSRVSLRSPARSASTACYASRHRQSAVMRLGGVGAACRSVRARFLECHAADDRGLR